MNGPAASFATKEVSAVISGAERLIEAVEFDVNGKAGKGGNGGLTSDETIRAAGELRVLVSRAKKEGQP